MLGMNMLLWTADVGPEHRPVLEMLSRTGYGLVEIPVFHGDPDKCAALAALLDEIGLARTALTARGADDNPVSPDPAVRRLAVENSCKAVDCAVALGASTLVGPFHSGFGVLSGAGPTRDEWQWAVEGMVEVAAYARPLGVKLSLEFLNRFECYLLNTTADAARFVEAVGADNVGILYDSHHANIEDPDIRETFKRHGRLFNHIHLSESHRGTPGTGLVSWPTLFEAISALNYRGDFVIEAFGQGVPELVSIVKIWRKTFDSEETLARDGYRFLRQHLH
jgi:D-psicose/D-tagatose/L-ribulose 3-epimerase